jgi:hypothetical protein
MQKSVETARKKQTFALNGQPETIVVTGNIGWLGQKIIRKEN